MNNESVIGLFLLYQLLSLIVLYLERDSVFRDLDKKTMVCRLFMLFLPTFVIISLILRPLE
jgi:putative effector of murein hydrolase LrgA (UPF0299 family)